MTQPVLAALRLPWRVAIAACSGALLVLSFPPFGIWPLSPLAVAVFTVFVHNVRLRDAAIIGFAFGMTFFLGLMPWLRVIGFDAWIALAALCAGFISLLAVGMAMVSRFPGWPLTSASLWVAAEAARDRIPFGGFPWGRLAFAHDDSSYTGWAAIGGAPLVTFVVALTAGLLASAVMSTSRTTALLVVSAAAGVVAVGLLIPRPIDGAELTVAVVQGNVPRTGLDAFGQREAVLRGHVEATYALAEDVRNGSVSAPDLVIWPENSSDIDPFADQSAYDLIDRAVRAIDRPTLVGVVTQTDDGKALLNSGVVWSPETGPGERYVKRHPVPFGEYVPLRSLLAPLISRLDRVPRDFQAGESPGLLQLGTTLVGDVICFEVAYDEVVRDVVDAGASVITVQTNNATYGNTGQVEQQLAMSRLRAVEHGRSVLVAATSGISAIIAPDGSVLERAPEFTRQVLVADVPTRESLTWATRLGALPELLLSALVLPPLLPPLTRLFQERRVHPISARKRRSHDKGDERDGR